MIPTRTAEFWYPLPTRVGESFHRPQSSNCCQTATLPLFQRDRISWRGKNVHPGWILAVPCCQVETGWVCVVLFFFGQLLALPLLSVKCFSSPAVLLLVFRSRWAFFVQSFRRRCKSHLIRRHPGILSQLAKFCFTTAERKIREKYQFFTNFPIFHEDSMSLT
jgi:hypothetical protein